MIMSDHIASSSVVISGIEGGDAAPGRAENVSDDVPAGLPSAAGNNVPHSSVYPNFLPESEASRETVTRTSREDDDKSILVYETKSFYAGSEGHICFMKMLIPESLAESMIDIGDITDYLRNATGAHVVMSKAMEWHPGSTDRVCTLTGSPQAIENSVRCIVKKFADRSQRDPASYDSTTANRALQRDKEDIYTEATFLVPDTTAGILIGKKGARMKQLNHITATGRLSSSKKIHPKGTMEERCFRCNGPFNYVMTIVRAVIDALVQDPQHRWFQHQVPWAKNNTSSPSNAAGSSIHVSENSHCSSRPDPLKGLQLVISLTNGVKDIIDDEMLEALRRQVNKANGGDLAETSQVLANLSMLSSHGMLCLAPAGTAATKDSLGMKR